jgi:hypothetical protein
MGQCQARSRATRACPRRQTLDPTSAFNPEANGSLRELIGQQIGLPEQNERENKHHATGWMNHRKPEDALNKVKV